MLSHMTTNRLHDLKRLSQMWSGGGGGGLAPVPVAFRLAEVDASSISWSMLAHDLNSTHYCLISGTTPSQANPPPIEKEFALPGDMLTSTRIQPAVSRLTDHKFTMQVNKTFNISKHFISNFHEYTSSL